MAQRILITGAAGFIGSHVAQAFLGQGNTVVAVDSFTPFYDRAIKQQNFKPAQDHGAVLHEIDITDAPSINSLFDSVQPDLVIHLAAWAGVRPSIENPALYAHVNVVGTQIILNAAVKAGVQRVIVASSSSVYGNNEKVPFAETDDVSQPISPYAATKVATELICKTVTHLHKLPISALRFFTVFGPRQRPDLAIAKFMHMIDAGKPIPVFGDGSTSRDYTFIDDIVDGVQRAADRCGSVKPFRVYNLGGEHPITLADMIQAIENTVAKKAIIDRKPEQPGDVNRTWADLKRSKEELGYQPATPFDQGLARQWSEAQTTEAAAHSNT